MEFRFDDGFFEPGEERWEEPKELLDDDFLSARERVVIAALLDRRESGGVGWSFPRLRSRSYCKASSSSCERLTVFLPFALALWIRSRVRCISASSGPGGLRSDICRFRSLCPSSLSSSESVSEP